MKRLSFLAIFLCVLLLFTGCRAAKDTQAAIDAIGTVTMNSGAQIDQAQALYDALSDFEKRFVENTDVLTGAHDTLALLRRQVEDAVSAIDAIGVVTMESKTSIEEAAALYNDLTEDQKQCVTNASVLTQAQEEYERLDGLIQAAREAIGSIGTVTLDSESAIQAARRAYTELEADDLTGYLEAEYAVLTDAEAAFETLYIADLLNQAQTLCSDGNYEQALEIYGTLLYGYPDSPEQDTYLQGAADASAGIARQLFNNGEVEEAHITIYDACQTYTATESCQTLQNEIDEYLEDIRPRNGKVFYKKFSSSRHQLKIIGGLTDMCIKLTRLEDEKSAMFYVRAGKKVTIELSDGEYQLEYAMGSYWYGEEEMFGKSTLYIRMEQPIEFESYRKGWTIYYTILTLDMTPSENGTMTPNIIPPEEF